MSRIARAGCCERGRGARFVNSDVEDLPVCGLAVAEHQVMIDRRVLLTIRVVDLDGREERVHAERARLVGDDRHDIRRDVLVAQKVLHQTHKSHGGCNLLLAGTLTRGRVELVFGKLDLATVILATLGQETAQFASTLKQVLHRRMVVIRLVVRRQIWIFFEHLVTDRDLAAIAKPLEVIGR